MSLIKNLAAGLRSLFHQESTEHEMDDELDEFLAASTAEKLRRGMNAEQAAKAARVEMGSANAVKHHIRSAGWESSLEILMQDIRYGSRALLRTPAFTTVAVFSLALGIGANTAIFTLINQVLLHSLPVRDPQKLVLFGESESSGILGGIDLGEADEYTYDFAQQLAARPGPLAGVAAYTSFLPRVNVRLADGAPTRQVLASLVSGNYFEVLGASPLIGRTIGSADAKAPGDAPVVVLSEHFWRQSLNADPGVLGRTISLNGTGFVVVGVMPEAFHGIKQGTELAEMWTPLTMIEAVTLQHGMLAPRSFYILNMFARRAAGSSVAADETWINAQIHNYIRAGEGAVISPARQQEIEHRHVKLLSGAQGVSYLRGSYGKSLQILMAVVAVVLLIACANLANFLLSRATARQRETATRLALGSSRARIVRQHLIESLLLSLTGGVLGMIVSFEATRTLISFVMQDVVSNALSPYPDGTILGFTMLISVVTALLFGLGPALSAARSSSAALHAGTRTMAGGGSRSSRFWPKALVVVQVAMSLLLLVGAGLFLQSLRNLLNQDFGFERTHLIVATVDPRLAGWKPEQAPALNDRLLAAVAAIPGVRSAALSENPPISFGQWLSTFSIPGYTPAPKEDMSSVLNRVTGQYFETNGIAIVAGRAIGPGDTASTMKVLVINEALAHHFFPHGDAVGRTLDVDIDSLKGPRQIVGIARDTLAGGPQNKPARQIYFPLSQMTDAKGVGTEESYSRIIELRTAGDPASVVGALRATIAGVDKNLPLIQVRTIREQVEAFTNRETLISRLTALFAGLALLLAAIGLYGVMHFNVVRRSNEIGIRLALGAGGGRMKWMVVRESLALLGVGLLFGLPAAFVCARLIGSQLYEMQPIDVAVFATATAVISAVTMLSAWLPARRAAAMDPMIALRCD